MLGECFSSEREDSAAESFVAVVHRESKKEDSSRKEGCPCSVADGLKQESVITHSRMDVFCNGVFLRA